MINISKQVDDTLRKGLKPFPNSPDIYWDMGVIHKETTLLVNKLLTELCGLIKTKYNLDYNVTDLIKENYE